MRSSIPWRRLPAGRVRRLRLQSRRQPSLRDRHPVARRSARRPAARADGPDAAAGGGATLCGATGYEIVRGDFGLPAGRLRDRARPQGGRGLFLSPAGRRIAPAESGPKASAFRFPAAAKAPDSGLLPAAPKADRRAACATACPRMPTVGGNFSAPTASQNRPGPKRSRSRCGCGFPRFCHRWLESAARRTTELPTHVSIHARVHLRHDRRGRSPMPRDWRERSKASPTSRRPASSRSSSRFCPNSVATLRIRRTSSRSRTTSTSTSASPPFRRTRRSAGKCRRAV